jgi:hypothetical protein
MEDKRSSAIWIIPAFVALLFIAPATYVGGYFLLSSGGEVSSPDGHLFGYARIYQQQWLANAFSPLAKLESQLTGTQTQVTSWEAIEALNQ